MLNLCMLSQCNIGTNKHILYDDNPIVIESKCLFLLLGLLFNIEKSQAVYLLTFFWVCMRATDLLRCSHYCVFAHHLFQLTCIISSQESTCTHIQSSTIFTSSVCKHVHVCARPSARSSWHADIWHKYHFMNIYCDEGHIYTVCM